MSARGWRAGRAARHDDDAARLRGRGVAPELVLLACSLLWLPLANLRFFQAALRGRPEGEWSTWGFAAALAIGLLAIHYILLGLLAWGRAFKPVVIVMLVVAAGAAHFISAYGVFLDPSMLRNTMATQWTEARELIGWPLVTAVLLGAALPGWLVWRLPLARRRWTAALAWRAGTLLLAFVALVVALLSSFQPLASLMRNQRELRYLITPANVVWSSAAVVHAESQQARAGPKHVVGEDARLGPAFATPGKPAVVVLVVGETARAANWQLNGYARPTTPGLAALPSVINFRDVASCGTDTETSLPCMFAAVGRRDHDARRIRNSENLLHVLARAGVAVRWVDNQSGCKGVCDGFPSTSVAALAPPGLCGAAARQATGSRIEDGSCLDEGLLHGLEESLTKAGGPQFLVLHQLGNHGPAYYRRIPAAFKRFQPACESDDLRQCSEEAIVNAYDNALAYTDHVVSSLVKRLQALEGQVDSAVIYVSDHGESLGERGLFLHGMPYAIAPDVQTRVPMVMWLSPGFAARRGVDPGCVAARAARPASHDHLFHSILGLLDVKTRARESPLDLLHGCDRQP